MPYPRHIEKIVIHLFRTTEREAAPKIYAILDAARDELIYKKISGSFSEILCLYHGERAVDLADVAPYLVPLEEDNPFTEWLFTKGWGNSWGIFLESSASPDQLRKHFQKFLTVYDEDGNPLYFRFYDPRVLRVYLPTCNTSELEIIFGPVNCYYIEGKEGNTLIDFRFPDKLKLIQNVIDL